MEYYSVVHRDSGAEGWDVYWSNGLQTPIKENNAPFKTRESAQDLADRRNTVANQNSKVRKEKMPNEKKNPIRFVVEADTDDIDIELITAKDRIIKRVDVPPFLEMPDVVIWGDRVFKITDGETDDGCYIYKEVFAYTVGG